MGRQIDIDTGYPYSSMPDVCYEWDREKAARNLRVHGITFADAIKAIQDYFAIEWIDDREVYGEERVNLLGMCDGVILHVTYTERRTNIRIISARRAQKHEQDYYYRENSP